MGLLKHFLKKQSSKQKSDFILFFKYLTNIFGKPTKCPPDVTYEESNLVDVFEKKNVKEVMQILAYFKKYHKKEQALIEKVIAHLVHKQEVWDSLPHPKGKNQRIVKVTEDTPWKYFHEVIRRRIFSDHKFVLVSSQNEKYYICIEYINNGQKTIQELGICDEGFRYEKCNCNFFEVQILCPKCDFYLENGKYTSACAHKSSKCIRCFKLEHGKPLPKEDEEHHAQKKKLQLSPSNNSPNSPLKTCPSSHKPSSELKDTKKHSQMKSPSSFSNNPQNSSENPSLPNESSSELRDTKKHSQTKSPPSPSNNPPNSSENPSLSCELSSKAVSNISPVLSHTTPANFNIVIMGPTGVGKSTWINALANYLQYNTLVDAKSNQLLDVIPVKFRIQDNDWNDYHIFHGKPSKNEQHIPGQSNTQRPQQYLFTFGSNKFNIIDTPGVTDTRGLAQDKINCQMILEEIKRLDPPQIHAIGIILKSNESRLTISLEHAIVSLLKLFPKVALENLVFFFTYARGTMFRIGDTYNALAKLFDQIEERHGTRIILSRESVYCVDNEVYRYLVVCAQKDPKLEDCMLKFEEYEDSWDKSQHESTRLFNHLCTTKLLEISKVMAFNAIKKVAEELAKLIIADEYKSDACKIYKVIIDYLINHSIITINPLKKAINRSKKQVPTHLEEYFVDNHIQHPEITEDKVYYCLKEMSVKNISTECRNAIENYINIYEKYSQSVVVNAPENENSMKNAESFNDIFIQQS